MRQQIISYWKHLRGRTYDFVDVLQPEYLVKTLPFSESATLYNQLWSMLGATESFARCIAVGSWMGWCVSLPSDPSRVTIDTLRAHLHKSDEFLFNALHQRDLLTPYFDGSTPMSHYFRLVEHESYHQGQLLNFMSVLNLPRPRSWTDEWALSH